MLSNHLISLIFLLIPSKCSWTKQLEHESWSLGQFVSGLFGISVLFWGSLFPAFGTSHMLNMLLWAVRLKPPPSRLKAQVTPRLRTSRNRQIARYIWWRNGLVTRTSPEGICCPRSLLSLFCAPESCSKQFCSIYKDSLSSFKLQASLLLFNCSGCIIICDPWTVKLQPSLSFTIFWSLLKFLSIELVMPGIMGEKRCSWEWLKPPSWVGS